MVFILFNEKIIKVKKDIAHNLFMKLLTLVIVAFEEVQKLIITYQINNTFVHTKMRKYFIKNKLEVSDLIFI